MNVFVYCNKNSMKFIQVEQDIIPTKKNNETFNNVFFSINVTETNIKSKFHFVV